MKAKEMIRFNVRLSLEQKEYLEYASRLGGFISLSDFILTSANNYADKIIDRHEQILDSAKDREIFFAALLSPGKPNVRLRAAAKNYHKHSKE